MKRRDFMRIGIASATLLDRQRSFGREHQSRNWRTFEINTRIEVLKPAGSTRVWVPTALIRTTPYQRTLFNRVQCERGVYKIIENRSDALGVVAAEFPAGVRPVVTVTSRVATKYWAVNLSTPLSRKQSDPADLKHFLRPTKYLPTDGIVKETAVEITKGASTDLDRAHIIYEWIVENTYRNPKVHGCGIGNVRFMLESKDLGGKCADLNALYVSLARAAGLPARDVYGIRTAKSDLGYKSLGVSSADITKSQHCRAEVYLTEYGWVPVDPADVRKAMLEEPPGNRPLNDAMVKNARSRLFGSWEMNWVAYNFAHDVILEGSNGPAIPFLMYPQAETADQRLDSLKPEIFKYEITSREVESD